MWRIFLTAGILIVAGWANYQLLLMNLHQLPLGPSLHLAMFLLMPGEVLFCLGLSCCTSETAWID